jgi:predicted type IV restriction endonuclease
VATASQGLLAMKKLCTCLGVNPDCAKCGGWGYIDEIGENLASPDTPSQAPPLTPSKPKRRTSSRPPGRFVCPECGVLVAKIVRHRNKWHPHATGKLFNPINYSRCPHCLTMILTRNLSTHFEVVHGIKFIDAAKVQKDGGNRSGYRVQTKEPQENIGSDLAGTCPASHVIGFVEQEGDAQINRLDEETVEEDLVKRTIEGLVKAIKEIRNDSSLLILDEASIKAAIIQRVLSLLEWNPFDINQVRPEYTVGSRRVDFCLRISGTNKAFIEVKRPNENLEPHQEQLLDYSFREGVKIAILTNGVTWWFYLPLSEGSWEERRFFTADLIEQPPESVAERFVALLSKDNIASGKAAENAEGLYKSGQKEAVVRQALPKAWDKLINDPDDLLVDLLIETAEKLSGFRPEIGDVEKFLAGIAHPQVSSSATPLSPTSPTPYQTMRRKGPATSANGYINKQIASFTLLGKQYRPRNWKDLMVTVSEEMYRRHSAEFDRALMLRGHTMAYFGLQSNVLSQPSRISDSKYFVETKLNANSIVRRCHELLSLFGYKDHDLTIEAR